MLSNAPFALRAGRFLSQAAVVIVIYHAPTHLCSLEHIEITMAEPIQSASAGDQDEEKKLPDNAEDRKAAAALDALNANAMSQENGESTSKQPSAADQDALGKAISRLGNASGTANKGASTDEKAQVKRDAEARKKIKLAAEDVNFLVGLPCIALAQRH